MNRYPINQEINLIYAFEELMKSLRESFKIDEINILVNISTNKVDRIEKIQSELFVKKIKSRVERMHQKLLKSKTNIQNNYN